MALKDVTSEPLPVLPAREDESHKGTYGRALVVGGSRGKAGAAALAGKAALRSGAGLVTVLVPRAIQETVASFEPAMMTVGLGASNCDELLQEFAPEIKELAKDKNCLALGPGLGTSASTFRLVHSLYHHVEQTMVVDADALNAMAAWSEGLKHPSGSRILTPHPGEFERLTGEPCADEARVRAEQAAALCRRDMTDQTVVVLKGHHTIVTDGSRVSFNQTGNPGMATGGTGDVLTGIITALVAQGLETWEAARLAVHVHGLAGDLAAEKLGQVSLIASDLLNFLPEVFLKMGNR
ncbi:NAD(P)H-hydrate dehydratase [Bythopirellula polymerisocia]|uniref:ADP-dependent (S)-NAD(P)H-hydrate dehydratase n=1 Tax=Bythopirellula polymerisocia TaxID=2528003 RepID=A0A5C6CVX9_9BACT|nr:NAD(P)H-hydrate dehydratase [Bythopirellula polymerisocia]TWU27834.1 ATP-dependent (S)-NAD(P)H-hydrate dehydratase [Bythopirellula polymerisocia]